MSSSSEPEHCSDEDFSEPSEDPSEDSSEESGESEGDEEPEEVDPDDDLVELPPTWTPVGLSELEEALARQRRFDRFDAVESVSAWEHAPHFLMSYDMLTCYASEMPDPKRRQGNFFQYLRAWGADFFTRRGLEAADLYNLLCSCKICSATLSPFGSSRKTTLQNARDSTKSGAIFAPAWYGGRCHGCLKKGRGLARAFCAECVLKTHRKIRATTVSLKKTPVVSECRPMVVLWEDIAKTLFRGGARARARAHELCPQKKARTR